MDDLAADLRHAVELLDARANVCRLVALADLEDALPARALSRAEAAALLAALADRGLCIVEPDAAARLTEAP